MISTDTSPSVFEHPIRIYWEDTDAGGIVFYANYLKFFERARTEWLRALGFGQQVLRDKSGGMFVVSETAIKYHSPARLDDTLIVTAQIATRRQSQPGHCPTRLPACWPKANQRPTLGRRHHPPRLGRQHHLETWPHSGRRSGSPEMNQDMSIVLAAAACQFRRATGGADFAQHLGGQLGGHCCASSRPSNASKISTKSLSAFFGQAPA
jgi:YbgC/YbaW family acyl-CoA thioester hydrolase